MNIPINEATANLEVKKSKFIAIARYCDTLQGVKDLVNETKKAHPDATHVVHAAVVGKEGTEFSFSDDKEPKNTAGRPAFEVLKGREITNIAVMIIRYFGGTKLGTGGLVKAYGDAMKAVLEKIQTEELIDKRSFKVMTSYDRYEPIKLILQKNGGTITDEEFTVGVTLSGNLPEKNTATLKAEIVERSNGKDTIQFSQDSTH